MPEEEQEMINSKILVEEQEMIGSQVMMEGQQRSALINEELSKDGVAEWQCPHCAWCLCEQGLELGNGSHGICPRHAEMLLRHYRAHHACCFRA
ncbi:hypothetical protein [Ktedonobacter sp. SOSP1-85]|uniref:hypothetical protein n=1 Tax=Ktedonobacter sp. SOSP1-85 TaxID=2778367 RepID=UPI001915DE7D|nr:hypothetical protein [Ktedonobacter sp. SOSP1-85]